jgi:hypothetical protein
MPSNMVDPAERSLATKVAYLYFFFLREVRPGRSLATKVMCH